MSDLTFTLDDSALRRDLALCKKQIPFAMALALTRTMQAAQKDTLAAESKVFHVRTDYLTSPKRPGYFRVVSAKKDNLAATLGTRAPLMEQEVFGGIKAAGKNGVEAVPTEEGHGSTVAPLRGDDNSGTLMRSDGKWPRMLAKKPAFFVLTAKDGRRYMMQRLGPARDDTQVVYLFEPTVKIKAILPFPRIVAAAVEKHWPIEVNKAVNEALWTAK